MTTYAVEITGLSYAYPSTPPVLRNVNLAVPHGSIYGFLGPNGAGKTTTLRLILGLLRRQAPTATGEQIRVLGLELTSEHARRHVLARTGSLIESPSVYAQLSAAENLRVWQVVCGCPRARIREVLQLVGLSDTGRKAAGDFSFGMRQRLGVAVALLASPELLVLDEPTNGLDPVGIIEMRELLQRLNRETGLTVLVSSHLLSEVEKLVTHVGIIKRGSMVFQGTLADLVQRAAATAHSVLSTDNNARAAALLMEKGWEAREVDDHLCLPPLPNRQLADANRELVGGGIGVHAIGAVRQDLEGIFMDLVRD